MKITYQDSDNQLPTNFAIALAESVGILIRHETEEFLAVDYLDQSLRLKQFQQMSVACSFPDAMIAFYGEEMTQDQMKALEAIYRSTKPWLLGSTVGTLMDRINNSKITNKDFAIAVTAIMEQINANGHTDGGGDLSQTKKVTAQLEGLVFKTADVDPNGKL